MSDKQYALIADDEEALRASLKRRLSEVWPELEIIQASNGIEALEQVAEYEPIVAFLDIRMPGLDGMEVALRLNGRCHLVFVTAFDEYAVSAFERNAVDYLLKPVRLDRLKKTVSRLKQCLRLEPSILVNDLLERLGHSSVESLQWIRAGIRDEVNLISVKNVLCFTASDKYTRVVTSEGEHLIRKSIKELEVELDPNCFWRIHRSSIVNLEYVERCLRDEAGKLRITIVGLSESLSVSKSYAFRFKQM